ncbi:MAG: glycoside hydrolase 5 family protein [Chloroflexota bacterium]
MHDDDFLLGVNYWPRRKAMYWWKDFDAGEVNDEFAQIAGLGVRLVRICLMWEDFQPEANRVDTRQLQNLGTVLNAAHGHGLRVTPTLLVGNMSNILWFPAWAFTDEPAADGHALQITGGHYTDRRLRSPFEDQGMLRAEAMLAEQAAAAIAGHPALHSWDLANEIDQACSPSGPGAATQWASRLVHAIHGVDPDVPVTYGAHHMSLDTHGLTIPALAPALDYLCMHGYPIYSDIARGPLDTELVPYVTALTASLGRKPTLMQEFGVCTAPTGVESHTVQDDFLGHMKPQFLASEEDEAAYYARVLDRLWQTGAMGALAWDFADYPESLWDRPPLDRAKRERTFGIFRANGSPKPAADVIARFAEEVRSGSLTSRLGSHGEQRVELRADPDAYYVDPKRSYREMYATYLDKVGARDHAPGRGDAGEKEKYSRSQ